MTSATFSLEKKASEDELSSESPLHSSGISVHLEGPVGESHVQRQPDQSVLINTA